MRWHTSRREWKRLCRCARGNTAVSVEEHVFAWNIGGLCADLGLVRKGWDELDAEAQSARRASQRKMMKRRASQRNMEWLRAQVAQSEPTVVFLEEVSGSFKEQALGLRRAFNLMGYETLMLPGEGGGAGTELSHANGDLRCGAQGQRRAIPLGFTLWRGRRRSSRRRPRHIHPPRLHPRLHPRPRPCASGGRHHHRHLSNTDVFSLVPPACICGCPVGDFNVHS